MCWIRSCSGLLACSAESTSVAADAGFAERRKGTDLCWSPYGGRQRSFSFPGGLCSAPLVFSAPRVVFCPVGACQGRKHPGAALLRRFGTRTEPSLHPGCGSLYFRKFHHGRSVRGVRKGPLSRPTILCEGRDLSDVFGTGPVCLRNRADFVLGVGPGCFRSRAVSPRASEEGVRALGVGGPIRRGEARGVVREEGKSGFESREENRKEEKGCSICDFVSWPVSERLR